MTKKAAAGFNKISKWIAAGDLQSGFYMLERIERETEKAVGFKAEKYNAAGNLKPATCWIPKSQLQEFTATSTRRAQHECSWSQIGSTAAKMRRDTYCDQREIQNQGRGRQARRMAFYADQRAMKKQRKADASSQGAGHKAYTSIHCRCIASQRPHQACIERSVSSSLSNQWSATQCEILIHAPRGEPSA